jgi:hypothetical protein
MAYITLEQAKDHLRVDFDDDDIYILALIDVCEAAVLNEIKAFTPAVGTVTTNGTTTLTGSDTAFTELKAGDVLKVEGETNRTIASITSDTVLSVTLAFSTSVSGLSFTVESSPLVSGVLPRPIYQAILLMTGHLYEHREPVIAGVGVQKIPFSMDYILAPYKTWVVR